MGWAQAREHSVPQRGLHMRFVVAGSAQSCGEHARNAPGRGFPACIAQVPERPGG